MKYVLPLKDERATLETTGGKGASLSRLASAGLPVPGGFHVTTAAYGHFVEENDLQDDLLAALQDVDLDRPATLEQASQAIQGLFAAAEIPEEIAGAIVEMYGTLPGTNPAVAVRSSATAEDLPEASFAGQQETYLNVSGPEALLEATKKCWASLWTARAIGYRARQEIAPGEVALAVVVQLLAPSEVAGIFFTAHPMTGQRDRVLISAAWGLGEAVVGGAVTPDEIVVQKESGRVLSRETAAKEVMTVRVDGGTKEEPVPQNLRRVPVLSDEAAAELAALGVHIEELYGMPMDVEWTWADGRFSIVQARPITGLPEVAVPPPDEWEPPEPRGRYMRASIIDFMPDPLSPLFATMGLDIYNQSMLKMVADVTDSEKAPLPEDVVLTIHDYAYMKASFSLGQWWGLLSKLGPRLVKLIRNGPDHFRQVALPEYREKVRRLDQHPVAGMTAAQIWHDAHELTDAAMYHLAILQVDTLGAAAGSEGLFTAIYHRFFQKEGDPPASAFVMGYDTTPIRAEKSLYDLAQWVLERPALADYLSDTESERIADALSGAEAPAGVAPEVWAEWKERVEAHLQSFGYILYDLDFAKPVPAEDPATQLETMKMYVRGQGANPHERQEKLARRRRQASEQLLGRARGLRGWAVRKALGWAQSVGEVREDSIASVGLAYPRLRELLKELGRRMADAGAITGPTDIFWLEEAEIEERLAALDEGRQLETMQETVDDRKKVRRAEARVVPPAQLPYSKTYMGLPVEMFLPAEGGQDGDRLQGVGASGGQVTGVARVLHGPEDFDQMQQGDILVAKLTTPAWTPLFAMAGGVVTDIGGPLSHGSIVAREYGIPAVLGTGVATKRIRSGQVVTVDGTSGLVTMANGEQPASG